MTAAGFAVSDTVGWSRPSPLYRQNTFLRHMLNSYPLLVVVAACRHGQVLFRRTGKAAQRSSGEAYWKGKGSNGAHCGTIAACGRDPARVFLLVPRTRFRQDHIKDLRTGRSLTKNTIVLPEHLREKKLRFKGLVYNKFHGRSFSDLNLHKKK